MAGHEKSSTAADVVAIRCGKGWRRGQVAIELVFFPLVGAERGKGEEVIGRELADLAGAVQFDGTVQIQAGLGPASHVHEKFAPSAQGIGEMAGRVQLVGPMHGAGPDFDAARELPAAKRRCLSPSRLVPLTGTGRSLWMRGSGLICANQAAPFSSS